MSRNQRSMLLALAAVAVLVAGFFIARAASGGDDEQADATATVTQITRTVVETTPGGRTTRTTTRTTTVPKKPAGPPVVVVNADAKPVGGVKRLTFEKGGTIDFRVRSAVADEVHFHGYDVHRHVTPGGTVRFRMPATIDGRFEVELHDSGELIARVEVRP